MLFYGVHLVIYIYIWCLKLLFFLIILMCSEIVHARWTWQNRPSKRVWMMTRPDCWSLAIWHGPSARCSHQLCQAVPLGSHEIGHVLQRTIPYSCHRTGLTFELMGKISTVFTGEPMNVTLRKNFTAQRNPVDFSLQNHCVPEVWGWWSSPWKHIWGMGVEAAGWFAQRGTMGMVQFLFIAGKWRKSNLYQWGSQKNGQDASL